MVQCYLLQVLHLELSIQDPVFIYKHVQQATVHMIDEQVNCLSLKAQSYVTRFSELEFGTESCARFMRKSHSIGESIDNEVIVDVSSGSENDEMDDSFDFDERIEKNFVITDPRLPDNPIVRFFQSFVVRFSSSKVSD
ncbi:hypothetical protein RYX36_007759 [Vicia faba]